MRDISRIFSACEWTLCSGLNFQRWQSIFCIMNVDRTVLHHVRNPHKLLRTTLMLLSMHVSEQYAAAYITDESLSVTSWLLTALFSITYQAQRITENHIKAVLDACEWIVCTCVYYRQKFVHWIMIVDRIVPHRAPNQRELLRSALMQLSIHVSE